ncbi:putative pentatricopeptide repeat-containing protein At3g49142 isoform X2 [Arachis ipaensis]|uniref:putative pentatricopeptide repeat-containing protein At3g49142 isoform X2 n=1 Tax=Arachis ipaensis TaxID=130454 RepID=UPI000A2B645C|nr:putative pentatricopeptide repeat-containing protein At3g49142 isoform X2 [Arachis ipaensis]
MSITIGLMMHCMFSRPWLMLHGALLKVRLDSNVFVGNGLIAMYGKCGCLLEARRALDEVPSRDVVSWNSMVAGYAQNMQFDDALEVCREMEALKQKPDAEMQNSGLSPDSIAFVAILSACSHSGLLDEGKIYFKQMTEKYNLTPRIEHFACYVDLLGRAGQVDEAYNFIKQMPVEPNERVWGALLSSCRVYSNMDIGLLAADNLLQLAPEQSGYYVLLSNIYAKAGRWKEVTAVRSLMKRRRIRKTPGISNVELNNQVHTFLAGDTLHPQSKEIYEELGVLVGKMKELGYVPETDSALHDVEEEDKECHLAVHSEKLAIVFALLNTQNSPIRITKNLRVCGDCHIAAKLISKIAGREIVVRDTNRFHHFKDGICSCGDYW